MPLRSDPCDWLDPRHREGADGEIRARAFLELAGWRILEHRFRAGRIEIDLIARREQVVAFVEVKTRVSRRFGTPAQAVTWNKQRDIGRAAQAWMDRYGRPSDVYRFDVIGVTWQGSAGWRVEHIPDAFRLAR